MARRDFQHCAADDVPVLLYQKNISSFCDRDNVDPIRDLDSVVRVQDLSVRKQHLVATDFHPAEKSSVDR